MQMKKIAFLNYCSAIDVEKWSLWLHYNIIFARPNKTNNN